MNELRDKLVAGKQMARRRLAALPFAEKLLLVERMRERSRLIATSPLRRAGRPGK